MRTKIKFCSFKQKVTVVWEKNCLFKFYYCFKRFLSLQYLTNFLMVKKISPYNLLNLFFYLFCLGIFKYIMNILQLTVFLLILYYFMWGSCYYLDCLNTKKCIGGQGEVLPLNVWYSAEALVLDPWSHFSLTPGALLLVPWRTSPWPLTHFSLT